MEQLQFLLHKGKVPNDDAVRFVCRQIWISEVYYLYCEAQSLQIMAIWYFIRIGDGLAHLLTSSDVKKYIFNSSRHLLHPTKQIYQHGTLRKVNILLGYLVPSTKKDVQLYGMS